MKSTSSQASICWPKFKQALKEFVFVAVDLVNSAFESPKEYPKSVRWEWREGLGDEREIKNHKLAVWRIERQLAKLAEYQQLLKVIGEERNLKSYLNGYEITGHSTSHIEEKYILQNFLSEFLSKIESKNNKSQCYCQLYPEFESALARTEIEIQIIAHLQGFYSNIESYQINDEIELKKLSWSELNELYGEEAFYREGSYHKYRHMLKSTCKWKRSISSTYPSQTEASFPEQDVINRMQTIVEIMRTFAPGYLNIDNTSYSPVKFEINSHGGGSISSTETLFGDPIVINTSDLEEFEQYYKKYLEFKPSENKKLSNAFRWLSNSSIKKNLDDKFLDYMIVLESLYLEERNELAYRLPLRAACLLEKDYLERNKTFRLLRKGYSLRSSMVHDGKLIPREIKIDTPDFTRTYRNEDFVNEISSIVYRTIRKIVISGGDDFPSNSDDWDKLILSN